MTAPHNLREETTEEVFGIGNSLVSEVLDAVENGDLPTINTLLDPLHPADIAHLIELINPRIR